MRIRELRERLGISQAELARRMGVKHTSVIQWETGKAMPAAAKLPKLAEVLGVEIGELFDRASA
ncbi:helix-turn-helix transcriptional regulator [Dysosmobacter sp. NSJ-60]|nr:helix-turn-helix transcriptional regulator [Dysosmobacter hominis]